MSIQIKAEMGAEQLKNKDEIHASKNIVFFDGVCNFCNKTVDQIWRYNKSEDLYFSSLQSDFAKRFLADMSADPLALNTIYFYGDGKLYQKSSAVLNIMKHFNPFLSTIGTIASLIPVFFRDPIYLLIARNRYRIAGKRESCRIPTAHEQTRFIL